MDIGPEIILETLRKAKDSERRRAVTCLHSPEDVLQRMVNAGFSSTYFRPHIHEDPNKNEEFSVLKGKIAVIFFDNYGLIKEYHVLKKGESIKIPQLMYHSLIFLSGEAAVYETSNGKYDPLKHKTFPQWAPPEDTEEAKVYLSNLRTKLNIRPKRVLITGISGFIAHHLAEAILRESDWEIVSIDSIDHAGTLNRLTDIDTWRDLHNRVRFVWHDLKAPINDLIIKQIGEIDYILHLAAGSHVDRSIQNPIDFVMDNVVGTVNLLEYARKLPSLKLFNYFSTDEVYGPAPEGVNFKETDPHNPKNPYAGTKAAAEDMCVAYENTYKLPIFITNTMNVFGERQHPEKFIPLVIKKILKGEKVVIHADPSKTKAGTRFYIHARNVASAVLFLLDNAKIGEKYNIVGEKEVDNLTLAKMIAEIIGKPLLFELVDFHSSRPGHDLRYGLDGAKLEKIGFGYSKNFEQSLRKTVEWYLKNPEWLHL